MFVTSLDTRDRPFINLTIAGHFFFISTRWYLVVNSLSIKHTDAPLSKSALIEISQFDVLILIGNIK